MAKLGMTQAALGSRIGMVQATVSARLCGKTAWTIDELTEVASVLDVPLAQLLPLDDFKAAS